MPVKREIPFDFGHFFITFTCYKWIPLIEMINGYDLVYNWFDYLKSKGHHITGYTVMPNHIYATIAFRKTAKSINKIIGDGKRFIGYEIIKRLQEKEMKTVLEQLSGAVKISEKKRGKLHEVWEDSFDWKECIGDDFTWQKIVYMHQNCCSGKWKLAEKAEEYFHSSAKFYLCGEHAAYPVLNYKQLDDIDLSYPH